MADVNGVRTTLAQHGQQHLLAFWETLDDAGRQKLLAQLEAVDWPLMTELIQSHVLQAPETSIPARIEPPHIHPPEPTNNEERALYDRARATGDRLLREGKAAAFLVAGGQGTRLGYDGPKGCYGVTPIRRKSLFQVFAEQLRATASRYDHAIPWYIMTSDANDEATRVFFDEHDYFGLNRDDVMFFAQGMMPAVGVDGKLLLAAKDSLALSPNGHGGSLAALADSGALADMARRGVELISYFQVDNPLVKIMDPLFLGLHAETGAEMSAKALPKREPLEKLGNFCMVDGKATVIEYSDLPEELAMQTEADGRLRFRAGSIAIHVLSRSFVERLTAGGRCRLPYHRAVKKVPCVDAAGNAIAPTEPNAVKLEMFVFDAMPLADGTMILETSRVEEFSPVKNATGVDSLVTCLHDQVRRAAEWLESAGVEIPRDADGLVASPIEISPLYALDAEELKRNLPPHLAFEAGEPLYLGQ